MEALLALEEKECGEPSGSPVIFGSLWSSGWLSFNSCSAAAALAGGEKEGGQRERGRERFGSLLQDLLNMLVELVEESLAVCLFFYLQSTNR
jgi:hypothetical protein